MPKSILFISPGPVYEIDSVKFEMLSKHFNGEIITSSPREKIVGIRTVSGFRLQCIKIDINKRIQSNLRFILKTLWYCINYRISGKTIDLVVTYDPLKTGLIGTICAFILNAKFAPEVNGIYTAPEEYIDEGSGISIKLKKMMYPIIEAFTLSMADGIKILFPTQLAPFQKIVGGKIIGCFPAFVDIDSFVQHKSRENRKEILFVGFPFWRKGLDILIKSFKSISDDFPEWKLKILGWFPKQKTLMEHIDGHPRIEYHQPVEYSEMPEHIGRSAIVAMASRSEAMGRVFVEAMAAGKPRIGTNVDGIPTVINDGVDGFLFEKNNVKDLSDKLSRLMSDSSLLKEMGLAAKQRALREFSKELFFARQIAFYHDVISGER